jgi:hypothetical protein
MKIAEGDAPLVVRLMIIKKSLTGKQKIKAARIYYCGSEMSIFMS